MTIHPLLYCDSDMDELWLLLNWWQQAKDNGSKQLDTEFPLAVDASPFPTKSKD